MAYAFTIPTCTIINTIQSVNVEVRPSMFRMMAVLFPSSIMEMTGWTCSIGNTKLFMKNKRRPGILDKGFQSFA